MCYKLDRSSSFAVIGHGSWATALVKILLEKEQRVSWYVHNPEVLEYILENGSNPKYLREVHFDLNKLEVSSDLNKIIESNQIIILAMPSAFLKVFLLDLTVSLKDKFIVSAIKGIVPDQNITVAEYVNSEYGLPFDQIGIITGPCHAEEVALERLSYLTIACKNVDNGEIIASKMSNKFIVCNTSTDIYGAEYASVLKNIYAIAVGICSGLGYGDNFTAVLISNATIEMKSFMDQTYPYERDIASSAYLGDLLVTSYSKFSRNRTFGLMIGKGYSVRSAQIETNMIAEGYYGAKCINQINTKHGVKLPIADAVYKILYNGANPSREIKQLTTQLK